MQIMVLGGAGRIIRESALDFVRTTDFERLTVADIDAAEAAAVADWLRANAGRALPGTIDHARIDVREPAAAEALAGRDLVMDGTPISLNDVSTARIAEAGAHTVNLNGMSREWDLDDVFRRRGRTCVPGFGMTPGTTNMMALAAARQLLKVDEVHISHGAFRPIAFSDAIAETTRIEYQPDLPSRVVFEDGEFIQVPPFARPRAIELPPPFGTHTQYIIPHPETVTLARTLAAKGVELIEVRGTWPPANMELLRALHDWGFLRNDIVRLGDAEFGILDAIGRYLRTSHEGTTTRLYGYALHVEVTGRAADGRRMCHVLINRHPPSGGSVPEWAGLRAYTRSVGIPLSIAARMILDGRVSGPGVLAPEEAFEPDAVFAELARREIVIEHTTEELDA